MSYLISAACVYLKCPGVAKSVLMQLADIANDHGSAWPSIETLCMRTDWARRAVISALGWLEDQGAIERDRSNGRHTVYRITPGKFKGERHPVPTKPAGPDQCILRTGAPNAPVHQVHPTSAPGAHDQCAKRTLITIEPPLNQETPQPPKGGAPGFSEFFAGYPRQVDEEQARAAWDRLAPSAELQGEIAQAIAVWIRSPEWQREDGRFIPKPGLWLRKRRWRDKPGITAPPAPPAPAPVPRVVHSPEQLAANAERARAAKAMAREVLGARMAA